MNNELNAVKDTLHQMAAQLDEMSCISQAGQGEYCSWYSHSERAADFFSLLTNFLL